MPGLTVWATSTPRKDDADLFAKAQGSMLHAPDYAAKVFMSRPWLHFGAVSYPLYPINSFTAGRQIVCFEGRVYNKRPDLLEAELTEIAGRAFAEPTLTRQGLERWIVETEGEYIVLIASPEDKELLVFTDPLGRLPLYYYVSDASLLLARECKFIQGLRPNPKYDRVGWAQTLWSGYPLGERTLFEDVKRAPGGMLLRACFRSRPARVSRSILFTFNFDEKDTSGKSAKQHASDLVDVFKSVCRKWGSHPDVTQNVLSLSGGHDSRAIAVAMADVRAPYVAATYLDARGRASVDARIARQVAETLGIQWHLFKTPIPEQKDIERLVRMKDGLNFAGMAYILSYLEQLSVKWGRGAAYISGDGGDKVFPDLRPSFRARSMESLAKGLVCWHGRSPISRAEAIMRLPRGLLLSEVREVISKYPEKAFSQKGVHFSVYERGRKWLYEGEDRTRFFLWHTSPFYAFSLFRHCMLVPDKLKSANRLYGLFMRRLSPECAAIPDATRGAAPADRTYFLRWWAHLWAVRLWMRVRRWRRIKGLLVFLLRGSVEKPSLPEDALEYIRSALSCDSTLAKLMSRHEVSTFLNIATEAEFNYLWTLVLLERLSTSRY